MPRRANVRSVLRHDLRGNYNEENQVLNFSTLLARSKHDYSVAEGGHKIPNFEAPLDQVLIESYLNYSEEKSLRDIAVQSIRPVWRPSTSLPHEQTTSEMGNMR